jgi:urea transport system substrate-binding protein
MPRSDTPTLLVESNLLTAATGIDPSVPLSASFPFLDRPTQPGAFGQFGPYPVMKLLGMGAAGFVFEAFDRELDRAVVLKVLRPELAADDEHRRRFVREAKAAAAVQSDYTVPIFAVGEHAGLPFIEMPLLAGESLQARLARAGVMAVAEAVEVARQTALGLADAHAAGLIHRDIKPANLWVEPDAGGGVRRVRLLDFGLARQSQQAGHLTHSGAVIGTPHYMSPEQAQGNPIDHRSDLFSLGVTLYALLTGRMPFAGSTLTAALVAAATKPHVPVDEINVQVPSRVADLIDRLLAKEPDDRPSSADEVAAELTDALDEMGVEFTFGTRSSGHSRPSPLGDPHPSARSRRTDPHPSARRSSNPIQVMAAGDTVLPPVRVAPRPGRWRWLLPSLATLAVAAVLVLGRWPADSPPIAVGVLHSQSGTMKLSEDPVIDATILAIDEVNEAGGVLGRRLRPVVADGMSDPDVFAAEADRLLAQEKVAVLFGCWTSASRKAVRPVVERHAGLLFYPVQYEGLERSPAVVYLGHAPNQQLLPAVDFLVTERKAKRLYLIGSDYVFPRTAHRIVRDHLKANHPAVEVAGEALRPLADDRWGKAIGEIIQARPDAVFNTINGSSNYAFLRDLRAKEDQLGLPHVPVLSVSVTANELAALPHSVVAGDYLAGTHFDLADEPNPFRDKVRRRFGADRPTSDMMAAAYTGVYLWAAAANKAGSTDPAAVRAAVGGMTFDGPAGRVTVDADTFHLHQPVRVARVQPDGGLTVVWQANDGRPVTPDPYPPTRTPAEWERLLKEVQVGYGGKWQAPPAR